MDSEHQVYTYSWHQSHDQATVLLLVPHETLPDDVLVVIEQNYLVAGIKGQPPIIKGKLYGNVMTNTSMWQLEPRYASGGARERTTSTASTFSTQSSYAYVSDPEISSSFAASLGSGQVSDNEDSDYASPGVSHPASRDELVAGTTAMAFPQHLQNLNTHLGSPRMPVSMTSSFSSMDSYQPGRSGRLLTLYLEKGDSVIWPSLVVGPVPEAFSPAATGPFGDEIEVERKYNMDPTSLGLLGEDLLDIREDREEAFEHFVRAWIQAQTPLSTLRLVTHFLPVSKSFSISDEEQPGRGTIGHYVKCVGGTNGLARLYLSAGLLHLEGSAAELMSSTYSALSSIRTAETRQAPTGETGTQAWRRDRESARRYFDRARQLSPQIDIPFLPLSDVELSRRPARRGDVATADLQMPSLEDDQAATLRPDSKPEQKAGEGRQVRRRRQEAVATTDTIVEQGDDDEDNTWYLYVPGLIGAGTALLVVGVVSALSLSSWRKNQN